MPDSNTDNNKNYLRKITNEEKWKEEFYTKTVQQLKTEERYVNYFKQFDPESVDGFIKYYANRKVQWFLSGANLKHYEQTKHNDWIKDCFVALVEIQQKKLFNAQCLWRAEKIQLPGIGICYDFQYWLDHIFAFKGITPIHEDEVEFYSRYLRETPCTVPFHQFCDYQDYDELKRLKRESGSVYEMQPYYSFYDDHEGTASYLDLPDIRSAKEEFYLNIYREDNKLNNKPQQPIQNQVTLPYLPYYGTDFIPDFVKRHETPAFYRKYQVYMRDRELNELNEFPEHTIGLLEEIPNDYLAIEAADDWRIAVTSLYERYRREKVIELLPQAFALYLKHKGRDWRYPGRSDYHELKIDPDKGLSRMMLNMILKGRELNGEPADLNF